MVRQRLTGGESAWSFIGSTRLHIKHCIVFNRIYIKCFQRIKLHTLDSSPISEAAGGSSRQKNCLTVIVARSSSSLVTVSMKCCSPRIRSSMKDMLKLFPNQRLRGMTSAFLGNSNLSCNKVKCKQISKL